MTENVSDIAAGLGGSALIAGYRVERQIGAGGMAVVFRAYDERLRRPVALKLMSQAAASDEGFRRPAGRRAGQAPGGPAREVRCPAACPLWRKPSSTIITPVVADGVVYAGGPLDGIVARRASDGTQLWRSSPGYFSTTPVVAGGVVYTAGPGSVYALRG